MKALVFAAGLGTRLRPLTDRIPKALVEVGGKPVLSRVIDKIRAAGIEDISVNACAHADQIVDFLSRNYPFVKVSVEKGEPLETGGGIKRAAGLLRGGRFLLHNADILSDLSLEWLFAHDDPSSLATLVVRNAESDRYLLFDDEMSLVGWTNVRTGEVKSPFRNFNPDACRRFSFCGIHILSDEVFALMEDWPERFGIMDFYLAACAERKIRGVVAENLTLVDIGSPETLQEARSLFHNV